MTLRPLPKANSGSFKREWKRVLNLLDLPRMIVVVDGALDRKTLEEVTRKIFRKTPIRMKQHSREELMGFTCERATQNQQEAFFLFKALDKAANKERHIVDSIQGDNVKERLNNYKALSFHRERSRLIWALARDGREEHGAMASALLQQTFDTLLPDDEAAAKALKSERAETLATDTEAAERLLDEVNVFKAQVHLQSEKLVQERGAREAAEAERAGLLAKLGLRERELADEQSRRRKGDEELKRMREETRELRDQLDKLDPEEFRTVRQERDRFRDRARNLQQKLERAEEMASLANENEALREEVASLESKCEVIEAELEQLKSEMGRKLEGEIERSAALRKALKTARQLASAPKKDAANSGKKGLRVGVFLDGENLMASARRDHGGRVDFRLLLGELVGERERVFSAVYIVDATPESASSDDERVKAFRGFARTLMASGYEVRQKKLRRRADGTSKGDWDMGIAMEILDMRNRLDVVILGSGDGDFVPLLTRLKSWGKRVEVASYRASTHAGVLRVADDYTDLTGRFRLARSGS